MRDVILVALLAGGAIPLIYYDYLDAAGACAANVPRAAA